MSDNLPSTLDAQFGVYTPQLKAVLPSSIPVERFNRIVLTAINNAPELLAADRRSLFNSCVSCAHDGLVPDGREAALVVFSTKVKDAQGRETWIKKVQYMPMVAGIRKRMRNSGEVNSAEAHVVYEHDSFSYRLGDDPHIHHTPVFGDRGKALGAYAVIKLKNGEVLRDVMTTAEIEASRKQGKAPNSLMWKDFWGEGARKTVLRRCSKAAPMSAEFDGVMHRDEDLEDAETPPSLPPPTREHIGQAWDLVSEDGEILETSGDSDVWVKAFGTRLAEATTDHEAFWHANEATLERLPQATQATLQDGYDRREAAIKATNAELRNNGGGSKTERQSAAAASDSDSARTLGAASQPPAPATSASSPSSGSASAPAKTPAPEYDAGAPAAQEHQGTVESGSGDTVIASNGPKPAFTLIDEKGEMVYAYQATADDAGKFMADLDMLCSMDKPLGKDIWTKNRRTVVTLATEYGLKTTAIDLGRKYGAEAKAS